MDFSEINQAFAQVESEIKNLKEQDPTLSKFEIIENILDYHERILRNQKEKNHRK